MKKLILISVLFLSSIYSFSQQNIQNSVVKIFATKQAYDYSEPWKSGTITNSSATGFIIEGNRILTNAHAVSNSKYLQVRFANSPEKLDVELEFISDDYDLAILKFGEKVEIPKVEFLTFGEIPKLQEKITVFGYPYGGDKMSITEGIISRIEIQKYAFSQKNFSAIQTDAAINPGNSGGPVIFDGKVIGVAFQSIHGANNIGYFIPSHIVKHFLNDVKDGSYEGIPSLGIKCLPLESKIYRNMLGMSEKETGILVKSINKNSISDNILQKNDVILNINNHTVGIDGSIEFRNDERIGFEYLLENMNIKDTLKLEYLRNGKRTKLNLVLETPKKESVIASFKSDIPPTFYISSGFIFEKLSVNYLNKYMKSMLTRKDTPYEMISLLDNEPNDVDEIVFLVSVLPDVANLGYQKLENLIISKVNGEKVMDMKDFIKKLNKSNYALIEDASGFEFVIDVSLSKKRDSIISEIYNISKLHSADLD